MFNKIQKMLPALAFLFILVLTTNISEQYLNLKLQIEMRSESSRFFLIVFLIIFTNLASVFIQEAVFLTQIERTDPLPQFSLRTRYADLIKENLKAIGSASLWMFVFIVPGIIRWIQYSLLPLIIFRNSDYQNGNHEALSLSRTITKNMPWTFYLLWILFNGILPLILSVIGGEYESFTETPIYAIFLSFFETLIFWSWMLILWDLYEKTLAKIQEDARPNELQNI